MHCCARLDSPRKAMLRSAPLVPMLQCVALVLVQADPRLKRQPPRTWTRCTWSIPPRSSSANIGRVSPRRSEPCALLRPSPLHIGPRVAAQWPNRRMYVMQSRVCLPLGFQIGVRCVPRGRLVARNDVRQTLPAQRTVWSAVCLSVCPEPLPLMCQSCPALPCPALPCPALPCPALPCPALPCGVL
jgi:hypothetical protein